ncbi:MAG: AI-2E family transporter [Clostridia bacterium]|nr:AI-2E family transporter [Clostridia bacterium]
MDIENNSNENRTKTFRDYKGIFWLIVACLAVFSLIWYFPSIKETVNYYLRYLASILCGLMFALILNPIVVLLHESFQKRFEASKRERVRKKAEVKARHWSIAIAITIGVLLVALVAMLIIPELLNSIKTFAKDIPDLIQRANSKLDEWNADKSWAGNFQKYVDTAFAQFEAWVNNSLLSSVSTITSAAWNVLKFILDFLIGFIIAIYILNEKKDFVKWSKKIVYATFKPETSNLIVDVGRVGYRVFGKYMLGSVIDSLVVGIICFIFNLIAGIPYSALIAALVGITNIIPFFGPFIGAIPSAIIIFIISPIKALIFIIFIFILQQIEGNIIAPKILGNVTGVSEFWVTFALLFFGAMFGFIGLILGVPMLAVIAYVIHRLTDKRAAKKGYPVDTEYYLEVHSYNIDEDRFEMIDHEAEKREEMEERVKPRNSGIAEFFSKLFKKIKNVFKHEK